MINQYKFICSWFGIGYIRRGGGTVAALFCCIFWFFIDRFHPGTIHLIIATLLITAVGIWSAGKVEAVWGKDSYRVVVDEVAGMATSLLFLPVQLKYLLTAFILFRFFDIVKPFYIRRLEKLPGGWGVMADDLLAGVYTNIIVQFIVWKDLY
jgi:phosphatidylglycerophosphatase A